MTEQQHSPAEPASATAEVPVIPAQAVEPPAHLDTPAAAHETPAADAAPANVPAANVPPDNVAAGVPEGPAPAAVLPPMPAGPPPPVPSAPPAVPDVPRVRKDRRVLKAALRWTAAVVVFAAVGASAAYGITRMERTDVPGLATASDGRWDYPEIVRPPLPSGSPRAFAPSNVANVHYADLRKLLLAAPAGATADKTLRGEDGWLPTKDFLAQFASEDDRDSLRTALTDNAVRHIAATGWTAADGTRTGIYLLQFDTAAAAQSVESEYLTSYDSPELALKGAADMRADETFPDSSAVTGVDRNLYAETKPYGATQSRQAYLSAGDVIALVVQSRKGGAEEVPFQQTVTLQSQLLG